MKAPPAFFPLFPLFRPPLFYPTCFNPPIQTHLLISDSFSLYANMWSSETFIRFSHSLIFFSFPLSPSHFFTFHLSNLIQWTSASLPLISAQILSTFWSNHLLLYPPTPHFSLSVPRHQSPNLLFHSSFAIFSRSTPHQFHPASVFCLSHFPPYSRGLTTEKFFSILTFRTF